jgi:hypothetical protein
MRSGYLNWIPHLQFRVGLKFEVFIFVHSILQYTCKWLPRWWCILESGILIILVCGFCMSFVDNREYSVLYIIRMWVSNYLQYWYKLYFNKNRKLIITSFFNIVPLLFSALLPSLHKLFYALMYVLKNVVSCGRGRAFVSSFMRNTCATILEFIYPFVDTVAAKHCFHIVLKVFDWFRPLIHLQTTKNGSLNAALPWCKRKAERPWLMLWLQQRNWPSNFKLVQQW